MSSSTSTMKLLIRLHGSLAAHQSPLTLSNQQQQQQAATPAHLFIVPSTLHISDLALRIRNKFNITHEIELCIDVATSSNPSTSAPIYAFLPHEEECAHALEPMAHVHVFAKAQSATASSTPVAVSSSFSSQPTQNIKAAAAPKTPIAPRSQQQQKRKRDNSSDASSTMKEIGAAAPSTPSASCKKMRKLQHQPLGDAPNDSGIVAASALPVIAKSAAASPAKSIAPLITISALPSSTTLPTAIRSKKKKRRGKKKKKAMTDIGTITPATPRLVAPVATKPTLKLKQAKSNSSSSSDSSSSSSSSSSDDDSDSDSDSSLVRPTPQRAAPVALSQTNFVLPASMPSSTTNHAPLSSLRKGHFKFTDDDDSKAVLVASNGTSSLSTPLFHITTKEHRPREKQQQQRNSRQERQPASIEREERKESSSPASHRHLGKSAIPWNYQKQQQTNTNIPSPKETMMDISVDATEATVLNLSEKESIELAVQEFGQNFIAPRTIRRVNGGNPPEQTKEIPIAVSKDNFDAHPLLDLTKVSLQVGDVLTYRLIELTAQWVPEVSAWKRMTLASAFAPSQPELHGTNDVVITAKDIVEARLIEGPSYTLQAAKWRDTLRAKKKNEKWNEKQAQRQESKEQDTSSKNLQPQQPPTTRPSTRYSLMSNVVRALQQKKSLDAASPSNSNRPIVETHARKSVPSVTSSSPLPSPFVLPTSLPSSHVLPSSSSAPTASPPPTALTRSDRPKSLTAQVANWSSAQVRAYFIARSLPDVARKCAQLQIDGAQLLALPSDQLKSRLDLHDATQLANVLRSLHVLRGEFVGHLDINNTSGLAFSPTKKVVATSSTTTSTTPAADVPIPSLSELDQLLQQKRRELEARQ